MSNELGKKPRNLLNFSCRFADEATKTERESLLQFSSSIRFQKKLTQTLDKFSQTHVQTLSQATQHTTSAFKQTKA